MTASTSTAPTSTTRWLAVCAEQRILPETGVAALVRGVQVAVFRLADGSLHAIDNLDPASGAQVMARGMVGDSTGRPIVAGPVYKQRFDLGTGRCLDDPALSVRVWPVRCSGGLVEVGVVEVTPAPLLAAASER